MTTYKICTVATTPFAGQKPGTSGLRKQVPVFQQPNYTENFIQCILDGALGSKKKGSTLVVGGDGRFFNTEAVDLIVKISAANGVSKLVLGQNGFLSTPAVSCLIRKLVTDGGIILTASHNPGGPKGDFGIKFNIANGGPAPDQVTDAIFDLSGKISEYKICPDLSVDVTKIGTNSFQIEEHGVFSTQVIDSVSDYAALMQEIFDLELIKKLLSGELTGTPFRLLIDSMHGATGPYVSQILGETLGAKKEDLLRANPLPDFGEGHPDPNLTYAKSLVDQMQRGNHDLGAAFDGDGDRNMILGRKAFFVTPSDTLAVLAANLSCIPYFQKTGVKGYARSMPTAGAVDRVAKETGKEMFEVPTGWKYFGNLMDAGRLSLCGEESFGTGSDHIREKDGLWACLAWLQVVAHHKGSVQGIVEQHWAKYGRNVFNRYDYEGCDAEKCNNMMDQLESKLGTLPGRELNAGGKTFRVVTADNFQYTDPVDASVASKQGIRLVFHDGSRLVLRLSGTGSSGATIRLYADSYIADPDQQKLSAKELLHPLIQVALELSELQEFTGRSEPTVIT